MFKIITYSILLVKTYDNEFLCFFNDIFCKKYDKKVISKNRKSSLRWAQAAFSLKINHVFVRRRCYDICCLLAPATPLVSVQADFVY